MGSRRTLATCIATTLLALGIASAPAASAAPATGPLTSGDLAAELAINGGTLGVAPVAGLAVSCFEPPDAAMGKNDTVNYVGQPGTVSGR